MYFYIVLHVTIVEKFTEFKSKAISKQKGHLYQISVIELFSIILYTLFRVDPTGNFYN